MKLPIAMIAAVLLAACGNGQSATAPEAEPLHLTAIPVREQDVVNPILATGEIHADKITEIKPRVDGTIDAVFVDVGDHVTLGQPLFRTRQADYRNRLAEHEQALALAQAELKQASGDLERAVSLRGKGVVSQGRMDEVQARFDTARARLGMADASLAQARQNLADATVTAPYDGIVTGRYVDEGTMIQVATSNTPVVEIAKLDTVEVIAQVAAAHLPRLRPDTRVTVAVEGVPAPIDAMLGVINDKVDASTRSVEIRLHLPNPDLAIKPGLFAKLTLHPAPRRAAVIERTALLGPAGDTYVYVEQDNVASRRAVQVRDVDAALVEVLSGLMPGDSALAGPALAQVKDGSPVIVGKTADGSR
ncbi:efflux RND transporter periplasmic adaptor subunit [Emcibacter sp. SYSU 3D8]|uniref:efflux RND transporter periplasmic adaptor subunit n=1 Tax=Emcibacter sp. SYSU 3D8 TaxID=3133969 RepID=UPI0031FEA7A3